MDLIHGQEAREKAMDCRLSEVQAKWLAGACANKLVEHGPSVVRNHSVDFDPAKWSDLAAPAVGNAGHITRGDVLDMAASPAMDVFTASYIFGMGTTGYGRSRYDKIRAQTQLSEVLERVRDIGLCQGPIFAYAQLYGGPDYKQRLRPGTSKWSRIARYGPAFFTKFLYFAVPGALILDTRLARRVARLVGNEHGYLKSGRPVAWTPYRYAIYLHWMRQAAIDASRYSNGLEITPDLVELTLFKLPLGDVRLPARSAHPTQDNDDDNYGEAAD